MQLERNAFISSLAKFTMLTTSTSLTEMRPKNIETIKTLCAVAYTDGNYLQTSWVDVSDSSVCVCVCVCACVCMCVCVYSEDQTQFEMHKRVGVLAVH